MAGGEENGGEGSLGERLPPSHEPPQPLAQGPPEEQPQLGSPHREDEQEEDGGEEEETERSEGRLEGVLDEDTAAEGLHTLGYSAPGTEYVYLHLTLPGRGLSDINILSGYTHLQKMELSCNKINDLSCVSHMPYLIELNASKNELTTYFDFKPPKNLRDVDFSHNQIPKMQDLSAYNSLTKLLLDYNEIEEIQGLEECHSLTQLGLSHNKLTAIRGLENLPIRILNLSFNQIEKVTGLKTLKALQKLDLSCNKINSLQGLEGHHLLEVIHLQDNQVAELSELKWIEDLPLLRALNLLKNPIQEKDGYWVLAIFSLRHIIELDLKKILVEEKVSAMNGLNPPPEDVAAEDHRTQLLFNIAQPQKLLDSTLPDANDPYPMLVLLGPLACGKRELAFKICRLFKSFFRFGLDCLESSMREKVLKLSAGFQRPCHTTRKAYFGEENRLDYYFISQEEFDKMVKTGKFLVTYRYTGHWYGLGRATVESIAREGLATCVHLEIEGVRSLKNTYFKPKYVLLVPKDKRKYEEYLRRTGLFTRPEIEEAVSRVDMCLQINQDLPGYFDAVINTDELDEAFAVLSHLVMFYLGMKPPGHFDNTELTRSRAEQKSSPGRRSHAPSWSPPVSDFLEPSARHYPRDLLDMMMAAPGSMEEASLQRRYTSARQALLLRNWDPNSMTPFWQFPMLMPPQSSGGARKVWHQSLREARGPGSHKSHILVLADANLAETLGIQVPLSSIQSPGEAKAEHQKPGGAARGQSTSKATKVPGESLQRKSKPQLHSPSCPHYKPLLPPIPPGRKSSSP